MKAMLTYSFIFDPSELWQDTGGGDTDLAVFFRDKGFEMEVVKESEDKPDNDYKKIIYLRKIPDVSLSAQPEKAVSVKQTIKNFEKKTINQSKE